MNEMGVELVFACFSEGCGWESEGRLGGICKGRGVIWAECICCGYEIGAVSSALETLD